MLVQQLATLCSKEKHLLFTFKRWLGLLGKEEGLWGKRRVISKTHCRLPCTFAGQISVWLINNCKPPFLTVTAFLLLSKVCLLLLRKLNEDELGHARSSLGTLNFLQEESSSWKDDLLFLPHNGSSSRFTLGNPLAEKLCAWFLCKLLYVTREEAWNQS